MTTATIEVTRPTQYRSVWGTWSHDAISGDSISLFRLLPILVESTMRPNWKCSRAWIKEEIEADNEICEGRTVGPVNSVDELLHSLGLE